MSLAEPSARWRLSREHIRPTGAAAAWPVEVVDATGSTNADLMAAVRDAAWPGHAAQTGLAPLAGARVLAAQHQSAGRGRQGRPWSGDHGLTFSVACAFAGEPAQLGGLSLAVGVAVADAVAAYAEANGGSAQALALKWPNDVQIAGRKLAGILVETVRCAPGQTWAVIGIGLNLERPRALETALGRGLSGVEELVDAPEPNAVFSALLTSLGEHLQRFGALGLAPFVAPFAARDAFAGQRVRLWQDGAVVLEGVAQGIDAHGRLAIESCGRVQWIHSGEVSLRAAEDAQP
ncbi:biotin--[acetyl-CoA-carboxylase] ligase [Ralstonia mannitolilytica]|uniref:biotin--[biotin carboxyl-carrier protein] ligase n=1 Tax=Ralstonia mannitolilytica TaxID=105219 RepID=A0AAD2EL44_9RALS|nr:biotin--[acetyl-CoA-carboxylase] ligase [Ralstonia mannitolilytica]MBY4720127.1 biotin--[acetyl-CoA-carboxylase] ligase [Ralstonia mannitolilytica]CAJ0690625.1 Bifunctional ligase/repressor BirA [Ralstonia mannitolilytica]CAJ0711364.1 Bifunctional ligase/repressor BirA [Ralstonia mannitolilytica]CAJ0883742.1 Bifunctional ligase/repressor BirA [Ralstonia mannitolilytica]